MNKKLIIISLFGLTLGIAGCKKFLDIGPENVILAEDALKTPEDAQRLLVSCYDVLGNTFDGRTQNIAELLSDNLERPLNNLDLIAVHDREVNFFTSTTNNIYADLYRAIFRANTVIESLDVFEGLSDGEKARMESEARFIRAICHWWTLKIWAQPWGYTPDNSHLGIVLRLGTDATPVPRNTVAECYSSIIEDLVYCYDNLPLANGNFASKYAAGALLSQVYFQQNNYSSAAAIASEVINSGNYALVQGLDSFHSMDNDIQFVTNPEAIFSIISFSSSELVDFRNEGFRDNYIPGQAGAQLSFSQDLFNLFSQGGNDPRTEAWISVEGGQNLNLRYGTPEDSVFLFNIPLIRLTHVKLIRAESLAELGTDLSTAIDDINDIRERSFGGPQANLSLSSSATQVIEAARLEFRKETVGEGYRIDQIRRLGAKGLPITVRGAPWNCPGMAIQFPNAEFTGASFVGNPEGGCD